MASCVFCDIIAGRSPASVAYRNESCIAFMDIQPVNPGHVLVVPTAHVTYLADLDPHVGGHMFAVAQRLAAAMRQSGPNVAGVNFFLADGEAAGQEVFHVHLHVFPRYRGDGFGLQFPPRYGELPARDHLDAAAAAISKALLPPE
jgi:histidine triad (HIT) family protein